MENAEEKPKYQWAPKYFTAEWIADQDAPVQQNINGLIRGMVRKRTDAKMSDKEIRKMQVADFIDMLMDFVNFYGMQTRYDFLERTSKD